MPAKTIVASCLSEEIKDRLLKFLRKDFPLDQFLEENPNPDSRVNWSIYLRVINDRAFRERERKIYYFAQGLRTAWEACNICRNNPFESKLDKQAIHIRIVELWHEFDVMMNGINNLASSVDSPCREYQWVDTNGQLDIEYYFKQGVINQQRFDELMEMRKR